MIANSYIIVLRLDSITPFSITPFSIQVTQRIYSVQNKNMGYVPLGNWKGKQKKGKEEETHLVQKSISDYWIW